MSTHLWNVQHHTIPAAHVRGSARGVRNEETAQLRLSVNQYIPRARDVSRSGDLSFVFCHGLGNCKEQSEPFFDDLLQTVSASRIRGVWCLDVAHHGESYMLNAGQLGDEPAWIDCARDVIHMINTFGPAMKTPIIGMGLSWGCTTLLYASQMHPRLFRGLVLIEPVIAVPDKINVPVRSNRNLWMAKREEIWPSRKAARDSLLQNKGYYALFDHRVFEKTMEHDLVSVAPEVARSAGVVLQSGEQPVRLKTPKSMQVYTLAGRAMSVSSLQKCMPLILPEVLLVWGELSDISAMQHYRDYIWNTVGTAPEGGGGAAKGQLEIVWIRKSRHAVALEQPTSLAEGVTPWLLRQAKDWEEEMKQRGNGGIAWTEESNSDLIHRLEKL